MKLSLTNLSVALAGFALLTLGASVQAQAPAYTMDDTTGPTLGNPPFTLGSQFTANSNVLVTALGIFDDSQDGLVDRYEVGLFDSIGNLLTSTIVPNGTAGTLINQFRYASITPFALSAGQTYEIGALYLDGNDGLIGPGFGGPTNFGTDPAITFNTSTYTSGNTLSAPLNSVGGAGYFGPNFIVSSTAVPEPGSVAMLIGMGATGAGVFLRRRRK